MPGIAPSDGVDPHFGTNSIIFISLTLTLGVGRHGHERDGRRDCHLGLEENKETLPDWAANNSVNTVNNQENFYAPSQ